MLFNITVLLKNNQILNFQIHKIFPVLPGRLTVLEAALDGPSSIHVSWQEPSEGGPIEGYNICYWSSLDTVTDIPVDNDVSDIFF